jgi:hypothetical protein
MDGVTYQEYEKDAAGNIQKLHQRLKEGKYRAQPLRRVYIPKENGKERPISIPALEDKIVQKATGEVLNAIYENARTGFDEDHTRRWTKWGESFAQGPRAGSWNWISPLTSIRS